MDTGMMPLKKNPSRLIGVGVGIGCFSPMNPPHRTPLHSLYSSGGKVIVSEAVVVVVIDLRWYRYRVVFKLILF
ncbi:MAG: hypothetical protein R6U13_09505 [Desulfatiglandaceae bacterium]